MELIADGLLLIATMVAALYCLILSRRLRRLTGMEGGLGKAITTMSAQVEEMKAALAASQKATAKAVGDLDARLLAAKAAAAQLEATTATADDLTATLREAAARAEAASEEAAARKPRARAASKTPARRKTAARKKAESEAPPEPPAAGKDPSPAGDAASARESSVIAAVDEIFSSEKQDDHDLLARRLTAAMSGELQADAAER